MLYFQERVIRTGMPLAGGTGRATRSTRDWSEARLGDGATPPIRQLVVESITPAIDCGVHASPAPTFANHHAVSPATGRSRIDERRGGPVPTGARTSDPRPESQTTAVAIVARNSSEVSRAPPGGMSPSPGAIERRATGTRAVA